MGSVCLHGCECVPAPVRVPTRVQILHLLHRAAGMGKGKGRVRVLLVDKKF